MSPKSFINWLNPLFSWILFFLIVKPFDGGVNHLFLIQKNNKPYFFMKKLGSNHHMGVSENVVYPIVPNGFADHYPYEKWLFHWEYTLFSDKSISRSI